MNSLLSFIRRKILRVPADRWNYQYQCGHWDYLGEEAARFDAVVGLIKKIGSTPSILEVGCGTGLLLQQLDPQQYSSFTGIDFSSVAINTARQYEQEHVSFQHADMLTYIPGHKYDIIAFNESLYYVQHPSAVFARYLQFLNPGGAIIVTAFVHKHTSRLWPALESKWHPVLRELVASGHNKWSIRMYQPAVRTAGSALHKASR